MDKQQQRALSMWLKQQSRLGKKWLMLTIAMAFLSGLFLLAQAGLLAHLLHSLIIEKVDKSTLVTPFIALGGVVIIRALCGCAKEKAAYRAGESIRQQIRQLLLDKLQRMGPATIQGKPAGSWVSLLLEQVEEMHDFFARYLPQLAIAVLLPLIILVAVFPVNWVVGLIFLLTAPLVPFFMALVGMGAADANRRNFSALQHLSGFFYDRLRGMSTLRLFNQTRAQSHHLELASNEFRLRTMEVLRLAFLSSAVLEFFTALSIALTAVYFGFSYIGELDFGHYGVEISLFTGLFVLVLAPEFYQPLRELGTFYHAKAQAVGAAESIVEFLDSSADAVLIDNASIDDASPNNHLHAQATNTAGNELSINPLAISIKAHDLEVLSADGKVLLGPIQFEITAGEKIAIIGTSGSGKTSLFNALLGFLPYRGSLQIAGQELKYVDLTEWRSQLSWVGQNPTLFHGNIAENIALSALDATDEAIQHVAKAAFADEFIQQLSNGYAYQLGDAASGISVGQAQRIALARALLQDGNCWLLDEPTASLDANSEQLILTSLNAATAHKTTLWVTHRLDNLAQFDRIFVIKHGKLVAEGSLEQLRQHPEFIAMLPEHRTPDHA